MSKQRINLGDCSMSNPNFEKLQNALWKARHAHKDLSKYEALLLAAVVEDYWILSAHPAGTESMIRKLRKLRRALKEQGEQYNDIMGPERGNGNILATDKATPCPHCNPVLGVSYTPSQFAELNHVQTVTSPYESIEVRICSACNNYISRPLWRIGEKP